VGFNTQSSVKIYAIDIDPEDRIYVGGNFQGKTYSNSSVAGVFRLLPDGSIDPTFVANTNFGGTTSIVKDLKIINDSVYVGGTFSPVGGLPLNQSNLFALNKDDGSPKTISGLINPVPTILQNWRNVGRGYNEEARYMFNNFYNKEIVFLTRGVDLYTEKQTIEYDLSRLFNLPQGQFKVKGQYYLNYPISLANNNQTTNSAWAIPGVLTTDWYDSFMTPQSHDIINNKNFVLYKKPFSNFTPSTWTAFTNNSVKYYTSTDKSRKDSLAFNDDQYRIKDFSNNGVYSEVSYNWVLGKNTFI